MSKKMDRALYGPSFVEVILGALLSFALGVVLATVFLVIKPVETVKELPKEPVKGAIYYLAGSKDGSKGKAIVRKRKALVAGQSVALTEDELNLAFDAPDKNKPAPPPPPPAKGKAPAPAPAAPAPAAPAANGPPLVAGAPNFRFLKDGELQIGIPCTINVNMLSYSQNVNVIATGTFTKDGDTVVFEPKTYYVGSLLVSRLPAVSSFVTKKILAASTLPEDLTEAWKKVGDVTLDGKQMTLTMK